MVVMPLDPESKDPPLCIYSSQVYQVEMLHAVQLQSKHHPYRADSFGLIAIPIVHIGAHVLCPSVPYKTYYKAEA